MVTFPNEEQISAGADDAFSYCESEGPQFVVFRSDLMKSEAFTRIFAQGCRVLGLPEEICATADSGLVPIEFLSSWHNVFGESSYELGIFWEFPFLMQMEYELAQAGSISAFGLSVPFGLANPTESYYGTQIWNQSEFSLEENLTQCLRFCDHPTFGPAGVYHVTDAFRTTYERTCYLPVYPQLGDSGFPGDP